MEVRKSCKAAAGRPREFDLDQALRHALHLFWSQGYEATSLTDLTEAMGISRPSLYAAFGNKESVFRRALALYQTEAGSSIAEAMQAPTAREAVERLMRDALARAADESKPAGCMLVSSALVGSDACAAVRRELAEARARQAELLSQRFEQAVEAGELPRSVDAAALARYFVTLTNGMSVQVSGGATAADLREVVRLAFEAWPGNEKPRL